MVSRFIAWNDLLLEEFFSPAYANEEIWIHAARDELDSFGLHLGGAEGLIDAVSLGPPWVHGRMGNCAEVARRLTGHRSTTPAPSGYHDPGISNAAYVGARAPTYLPILALWVLASSEVGKEGFYDAVSKLLGTPFPNTTRVTDAMQGVWEDLETWSNHECNGRFGLFKRRVLGEHRFVGIPRSQCLISRSDARGMAQLFWELRLRPGQALPGTVLRQVLEHGREAQFLTRGLRSAMESPDYAEPLEHLVRRLLASWDGRRPRTDAPAGGSHPSQQARSRCEEEPNELTVALLESDELTNGWDVRWRIPAMASATYCMLEAQGSRVPASLDRSGAWFLTSVAPTGQDLLAASATRHVDVNVCLGEDEQGVDGDTRRAHVRRASRRILVWNVPDPRFGEQLIERELPLYGPLYVLSSPTGCSDTEQWLRREGIPFDTMNVVGLPQGWWMACIERAEQLHAKQRQYLSGDAEPCSTPRARIRLIGGRSLLKGGSRLFAAYDLPLVEVEGPPGSILVADGLDLAETTYGERGMGKSSIRRFEARIAAEGRGAFTLQVVAGKEVLAATRMRIASADGEGRGEVRSFSLDRLGRPTTDPGGLRGAVITPTYLERDAASRFEAFTVEETSLASNAHCSPQESVAGRFLDSLAALGSMGYGPARDLIMRLSSDIEPIPLLMDLRARGHLEIQADAKGHLVRIHRVDPALYALPATQDGLPIFGVCGSLRLRDWATLQANGDFIHLLQEGSHGRLPVLRLVAADPDAVKAACCSMDFQFCQHPAAAVADWAGSIRDAREAMVSRGWEHFSAELVHLHRLQPNSATFLPVPGSRMDIDRQVRMQLFRFDDPQAAALQLYVLGAIQPGGATRYAHVHDSRWGVWISLLAFAEMVRDCLGRQDACPWPVHYDPTTRDVWLPARLRPPAVLERALALCSGSGPEVHVLSSGGQLGNGLLLVDGTSRKPIGLGSLVYDGFLPGTWLRYRWIPAGLAGKVAGQLGGTLKPLLHVARDAQHETAPA